MSDQALNILDALENLNALMDANSLEDIEITDDAHLIAHKRALEESLEEDYWVKAGPDEQTLEAIQVTFGVVRDYLLHTYPKIQEMGNSKHSIEGINTIMVLVGEAAKKMERFGAVFKRQVMNFPEFKELQNFYRDRVIKESFKEFSKKPIPKAKIAEEIEAEEHARLEEVEEIAGVHILNDIDVIKRDHLYELFYLKNEAGHNFYTYELARNIKLACDFGEFSEEYFGDDPLLQIKSWEDKALHLVSQQILSSNKRLIEKFYKESMKYKEVEMVKQLNHSLMALMLAANPRNLIRQFSLKGCHLYFKDFLCFLRDVLNNRDYQKFMLYSAPEKASFFQNLLDLVHELCHSLYTLKSEDQELQGSLKQMIEKNTHKKSKTLSQNLLNANQALLEATKNHPSGPVFKAVDIIREDEAGRILDPLVEGNIPEKQWCILIDDHELSVIRMACPVLQELINKAHICEDFKAFLNSMGSNEHLLYFNFQDRTSWKEFARCQSLEELSKQAEFSKSLTVITMSKDTEFYNQTGLYEDQKEASIFKEQLVEHLGEEISGYYFPKSVKKQLFPTFIQKLSEQIHKTFFQDNKRLSQAERLDFIQLTYHFIELKLLELLHPTFTTLSSKDGLDIGATSSVGLIALLSLSNGKKWKEQELEKLHAILFGPTLMNRERVIHQERFERLISLIQCLEKRGEYLTDFAPLYEKKTLNWKVSLI
ncbi:MAG: hypothetical protein S4CHLAM123_12560 [Chlamydiales bacterium]|nr:hypothetical protein [Chlamydiales bacterium]